MIGKNQFNSVYRLHLYRKALQRLKQMGFVRVFSDNLADAAGVTPTSAPIERVVQRELRLVPLAEM